MATIKCKSHLVMLEIMSEWVPTILYFMSKIHTYHKTVYIDF